MERINRRFAGRPKDDFARSNNTLKPNKGLSSGLRYPPLRFSLAAVVAVLLLVVVVLRTWSLENRPLIQSTTMSTLEVAMAIRSLNNNNNNNNNSSRANSSSSLRASSFLFQEPPSTTTSTTTTTTSTQESQNSHPLQVDCAALLDDNPTTSLSKNDTSPASSSLAYEMARTKTRVPFDMSTYPAGHYVWVSHTIQRDGCWECDVIDRILDALQGGDAVPSSSSSSVNRNNRQQDNHGNRNHGNHQNDNHDNTATPFLLDMGGNIGMMTLSALAAGHESYVFEPFEKNQRHLCRSTLANNNNNHKVNNHHPNNRIGDWTDRLHLLGAALVSTPGRVHFQNHQQTNNFGGINIVPQKHQGSSAAAASSSLPPQTSLLRQGVDYAHGVTLDSLRDILPHPHRPVVIKLDVEGAEIQALTGGLEFLKSRRSIRLACLELRKSTLWQNAADTDAVFAVLRSKGLRPMRNVRGALEPLATEWRQWKVGSGPFDVTWVLG